MKEKIKALLERELAKLDRLSTTSADVLETDSIRKLDLLVKCYSSYSAPIKPKESLPEAPENQSTEDLLKSLTES